MSEDLEITESTAPRMYGGNDARIQPSLEPTLTKGALLNGVITYPNFIKRG